MIHEPVIFFMVKTATVLIYGQHNLSKAVYCLSSLLWTKSPKSTEVLITHINPQLLQSQFNNINSLIFIHEEERGPVISQQTMGWVAGTVPPVVQCRIHSPNTFMLGVSIGWGWFFPSASVPALLFPPLCSNKWLCTWLGVKVEIIGFVKLMSCKQLEFSIYFFSLGKTAYFSWCKVIPTAAVSVVWELQGNKVLDSHWWFFKKQPNQTGQSDHWLESLSRK